MAATISVIDPYTASHQQRVAQLACALAAAMGLSQECLQPLRMAGAIHDLGMMVIPAELLAKPGRLTDTEFALIKTHPQVAADILKPIRFPEQVTEIILQHHERMDGSGYPRGLKGKNILLEARILGVADVIESMCSHRPYRPALGLDQALKEISRGRDALYDREVVDTCIRLYGDIQRTAESFMAPALTATPLRLVNHRDSVQKQGQGMGRRLLAQCAGNPWPRTLLKFAAASACAIMFSLGSRGA